MLKFTGVELELITDPDMYLFFEKGLRGGITTAVTKYASDNFVGEKLVNEMAPITNHAVRGTFREIFI